MKKYIISPIGSALIVPGFGQVLNGQIKKGLILMGIVFVIVITGVIKLALIINNMLPELNPDQINRSEIIERINTIDLSILKLVIFTLFAIWIYSIIDAFIIGIKVEKERN